MDVTNSITFAVSRIFFIVYVLLTIILVSEDTEYQEVDTYKQIFAHVSGILSAGLSFIGIITTLAMVILYLTVERFILSKENLQERFKNIGLADISAIFFVFLLLVTSAWMRAFYIFKILSILVIYVFFVYMLVFRDSVRFSRGEVKEGDSRNILEILRERKLERLPILRYIYIFSTVLIIFMII